MSSFRFQSNPTPRCHEVVNLRDGHMAPRARAAMIAIAISALPSTNYEALCDLVTACSSPQHQISPNNAKLLIRSGLLESLNGNEVRVPELVLHVLMSMLPKPGTGDKLLSPFAE